MQLVKEDGQSLVSAYKEYLVAVLIGSRKWRRDLITHWTTHGGSDFITINSKTYWGGTFSLQHLNEHPDMVKMADYLGIDDAGKSEISNIGNDADWTHAYFRPKPKSENPYTAENVAYMFNNGLRPLCVSKGLSSVVFKSANIDVPFVYFTRTVIDVNGVVTSDTISYQSSYLPENSSVSSSSVTTGMPPNEVTTVTTTTITTGLDSPYNHIPSAINMKGGIRTSASFVGLDIYNTTHDVTSDLLVTPLNALGNSGVGNVLGAIYNCTGFFEQFCPHTISVELIRTVDSLLHIGSKWIFQAWDSFSMGDYSWMNVNNVIDYLYPSLVIGASKEDDYFGFSTSNNFKGRATKTQHIKNLSGYVMDIIDGSITGNTLLSDILHPSPYTWAIVDNNRLWFEYDYIMAMDIKEFAHLLTLHLDIEAGKDSSGFWGSFIGSFVGAVLKLVSTVIGAFFKVVELCDFIMKPTIRAVLKMLGVNGVKLDRIMAAYTEIRNQIALIVVTLGIGAYIKAASATAEISAATVEAGGSALTASESGMILDNFMEMAFTFSNTQLAGYALNVGMGAFGAVNAVGGSASQPVHTVEEVERSSNPMQIVYGDSNIDIVDAIYMSMDDPMMMLEMANDPFAIVYS